MSFESELDEYEAQHELEVREEYHDVQSLFAWRVIACDCIYLANGVDVTEKGSPEHHVWEIKLEDAWVWDLDRSPRLLPQAVIYTHGDFAVEKLPEKDFSSKELDKK